MAFNRELSFESSLLKPHKEKWQITLLFSILFTATKKNKQKEAYPAVRRTY